MAERQPGQWGPDAVTEIIESLQGQGFEPPFFWVLVGANGAMVYAKTTPRVDEAGFDCEFLAEHYPDGEDVGLEMPGNLMVCDRLGQAAKTQVLPGTK
jgi:hypothetical protein